MNITIPKMLKIDLIDPVVLVSVLFHALLQHLVVAGAAAAVVGTSVMVGSGMVVTITGAGAGLKFPFAGTVGVRVGITPRDECGPYVGIAGAGAAAGAKVTIGSRFS